MTLSAKIYFVVVHIRQSNRPGEPETIEKRHSKMKWDKHVPHNIDQWPNMKSDVKHLKIFFFQICLSILDAEVLQESRDADNLKMHNRSTYCKVR